MDLTMNPEDLGPMLASLSDEELADLVDGLPPAVADTVLAHLGSASSSIPPTPLAQAQELDRGYRARAHLVYLSDRLAQAVTDVENGRSRQIKVSMPPRMGKSTLLSLYLIVWVLRRHPDWNIGMISHEANFAVSWGRQVRRTVEQRPELGIALAPDAGAAGEWETTKGGGVLARGVGGSLTGRGFKVMVIDDAVKDFATAHSEKSRQSLWDWWLSVPQTRLEPPSLTIVVGTRWHQDDILGRLGSSEFEGDPEEWEVITFPAIAESASDDHGPDVLGREPGDPLISPLLDETHEEALTRWEGLKRSVGTYTFSALYQQAPAPSKGAIFDTSWWRYWTTDPSKVTDDGRVMLFDPVEAARSGGRWLDSWDCAFKGTDSSDYVVGQRWHKRGPFRYLIKQHRKRMAFTETVEVMQRWASDEYVHESVVEDKANGTAVIDVLKTQVSGIIPINPTDSKQARAYAVTPECESGHVVLPLPSDPGNEWVMDLLSELRNFPHGAHDDQTDGLTQALTRLRTVPGSRVTNPNDVTQGRTPPPERTGGGPNPRRLRSVRSATSATIAR